jgi:hypothetical protein
MAPPEEALFERKGGVGGNWPAFRPGLMQHSHIVTIRAKPFYGDALPLAGVRSWNNDVDRQHVVPVRGGIVARVPGIRKEMTWLKKLTLGLHSRSIRAFLGETFARPSRIGAGRLNSQQDCYPPPTSRIHQDYNNPCDSS